MSFQTQVLKQMDELNDNNLVALYNLYGEELEQALNIIDQKALVKYVDDQYQSMPEFYTTTDFRHFVTARHCSCQSFCNKVRKGHCLVCKHVLAVQLSKKFMADAAFDVVSDPTKYQFAFQQFTKQILEDKVTVTLDLSGLDRMLAKNQ